MSDRPDCAERATQHEQEVGQCCLRMDANNGSPYDPVVMALHELGRTIAIAGDQLARAIYDIRGGR